MARVTLTAEPEGAVGVWRCDEADGRVTVWFDHYPESPERPYLATIDHSGMELCDTRPGEARKRVEAMAAMLPVLREAIAAAEAFERDGTLPEAK